MPLLLFASFVLFVCVHGNLPRFSRVRFSRVRCPALLFLLYVRLTKSKTAYFGRVPALYVGVVCVAVHGVRTQHAPRKRANLARFDVLQFSA